MASPIIGEAAPAVSAPAFWRGRAEAEEFNFDLADYQGQKIILAFYPGDFTPVCTAEMCDFSDNISALSKLNALVVGLSTDDIAKHRKFAARYNFDFPLVADVDKQVGKRYDVVGPILGTRHRRAIFIIDENGKLVWKKIEATAAFRTTAKEIEKVLQTL